MVAAAVVINPSVSCLLELMLRDGALFEEERRPPPMARASTAVIKPESHNQSHWTKVSVNTFS
jgi:hypothetical protein